MSVEHPEQVIARQLAAYNARDLEAFMACWAPDARFLAWPDTLLAKGADAIRERHRTRFDEAVLHGDLIARVTVANLVIDHERVTRNYPEGLGSAEVLAIYEVEDGLIRAARFKQGPVILSSGGTIRYPSRLPMRETG